jgi:type I restriction-modification system DNA methylase subunit
MHIQNLKSTDQIFRQFGIEGEDTFKVIAAHYLNHHEPEQVSENLRCLWKEGNSLFRLIKSDKIAHQTLEYLTTTDLYGESLPIIYQYFLTKRFRDLSGKFFTPRSLANIMTCMLPVKEGALIFDPACGGGTFLVEAAKRWAKSACRLIGNDVDKLLLCLSELSLLLSKSKLHTLSLFNENIYDFNDGISSLLGQVDYILANPPFSLAIESFTLKSKLFDVGYRNSDALFLDLALEALKPGGHLVCLLPHSIVANKEFEKFRRIIESDWEISAIIVMPEATFSATSNTTTRADIIYLRKRGEHPLVSKLIFGNVSNLDHLELKTDDFLTSYPELSHLFDDFMISQNMN